MSNSFIEKYPATPVDRFKWELWLKTHPCFYVIILITLWEKNLVQSFVVLWSVLMKLWSYKVLNPAWVTSYRRIYKAFYSWFSLHIFVNFMKKESFTQFTALTISHEFIEVVKFWLIKLCLDVNDAIHANEHK